MQGTEEATGVVRSGRWPLVVVAVALLVGVAVWWSALRDGPVVAASAPVSPAVASRPAASPPVHPREEGPGGRTPKVVDRVELGVFVDSAGEAGPGAPVVLGLHGRGGAAAAFAELGPRLSARLRFRALQAPLRWHHGWAWFPSGPRASPDAALKVAVERVQAHVRSMGDRPLALLGFSQGCMTLLHYLARHPARAAAAVCIGGAVVGELPVPQGKPRTPILFVHGADDRVVPPAAAHKAIQAMENRGFHTELIEHAGGHVIPRDDMPRIRGWLESRLALDQPGAARRD